MDSPGYTSVAWPFILSETVIGLGDELSIREAVQLGVGLRSSPAVTRRNRYA
jgi:hypothetical protein